MGKNTQFNLLFFWGKSLISRRKQRNKPTLQVGAIFIVLILSLACISISYASFIDNKKAYAEIDSNEDLNVLCLVSFYKLDEDTGINAQDSSPYEHNGTVNGAVWTTGKINNALFFDGINDYVNCGDIQQIDSATELTITAWVKVEDLTRDNDIIAKDVHNVNSQLLLWRDETGSLTGNKDTFSILVSDGSNDARIEGAEDASSDTEWHHIAISFIADNPQGLRLFIDGSEDPNSPVSTEGIISLESNSNPLLIGKPVSTANKEFSGKIDEVKIYKCALSADDILYEYERGV